MSPSCLQYVCMCVCGGVDSVHVCLGRVGAHVFSVGWGAPLWRTWLVLVTGFGPGDWWGSEHCTGSMNKLLGHAFTAWCFVSWFWLPHGTLCSHLRSSPRVVFFPSPRADSPWLIIRGPAPTRLVGDASPPPSVLRPFCSHIAWQQPLTAYSFAGKQATPRVLALSLGGSSGTGLGGWCGPFPCAEKPSVQTGRTCHQMSSSFLGSSRCSYWLLHVSQGQI